MALILTLDVDESFFLNEVEVKVVKVYRNHHFVLETQDGTHHEIVLDRMAEVMPDVFVSSGNRAGPGLARVVIDAPPEIKIRRSPRQKVR
jgi:sRNA-binding carbon storage regulator CsrA